MTGPTRSFKPALRLGLALAFVAAAIWANLPHQSAMPRHSAVMTEFITLGVDPAPKGFLNRFIPASPEQLRASRKAWVAHIHPEYLAAYARAFDIAPEDLKRQILDPATPDRFDISATPPPAPEDMALARHGAWQTVLVRPRPTDPTPWLLYFTDTEWFFAPLHDPRAITALHAAHPALNGVRITP